MDSKNQHSLFTVIRIWSQQLWKSGLKQLCENVLICRNKIRQQIAEALSLAEEDCPDCDAGARAAELESAVLDQNRGVNPKYKAKIRSLWVNLKDPKNPDFRAAVLAGDITGKCITLSSPLVICPCGPEPQRGLGI